MRQPAGAHSIAIATGPALSLAGLTSTVEVMLALSSIPGQLPVLVAADTVTFFIPPSGMLPKLHIRTLLVIMHAPASGPLTIQLRPPGRLSFRTTFCDVPGPFAVTTMSNTAVSPALID